MATNRQWRVVSPPGNAVREENFEWSVSEALQPAEGQFLVQNLWLSLDPTQVLAMPSYAEASAGSPGRPRGGVMEGLAVSRVLESRHGSFAPGDLVYGGAGWEDFSVIDGLGFLPTTRLPPDLPPRLAVGTLGVTGMAAYFGVTEVARPRPGEMFVVSGAAGGVGSVAGQIARILGLRTVGIAGGKSKCDWLRRVARLDAVIDHRSEEVGQRLSELCPDGIDIFFDNVGGPVLDDALERLRLEGRVVVCGATSRYGISPQPPGPANYLNLCLVRGRMEGVLARDHAARFPEARAALRRWIETGELTSQEDVAYGLASAPAALVRLFHGSNLGKQLVEMDPPSSTGEASSAVRPT